MNLLDLLFPKRCLGCGKMGRYFCSWCLFGIQTIDLCEALCPVCEKPAIDGRTHPRCRGVYQIDGLTSFFHYTGAVKNAIKSVKYRYAFDVFGELFQHAPLTSHNYSTLLRRYCPSQNEFIVIPIPLHPSRLRFRGFNQAEYIARFVGSALHLSMRTDVLRRTGATTPQVDVKVRAKRIANMKGVFSMNQNILVMPKAVLLCDDVFTTGATLREAAKILKHAGMKFVWGVTLAR